MNLFIVSLLHLQVTQNIVDTMRKESSSFTESLFEDSPPDTSPLFRT